jgi:hypothetical protein
MDEAMKRKTAQVARSLSVEPGQGALPAGLALLKAAKQSQLSTSDR